MKSSVVAQLRAVPLAVTLVVVRGGTGPAPISACSTVPTVAATM
jgi:hypothetical protein